jgi:hypothetical protein
VFELNLFNALNANLTALGISFKIPQISYPLNMTSKVVLASTALIQLYEYLVKVQNCVEHFSVENLSHFLSSIRDQGLLALLIWVFSVPMVTYFANNFEMNLI